MTFKEFLEPDVILPSVKANNKRQLFQVIADYAARDTGLDNAILFDRLIKWESKSASSGIGGGAAVLHLTSAAIDKPFFLMARAENRIDYDSVDGAPVDLAALVISPEDDGPLHLQRLYRISRLLRSQEFCKRLRGAVTADALRAVLFETGNATLAA